ncbi:hypothetical protein WISP_123539 [Willisornis vidua]|uniref:Uncharacterized protein n=1 Tax=Willisornis vidua TaxID=1566151 RepID=A0ABQ9CRV4_9PASS|nr:hypothetical protein WISP_123539 [Willisornis vidua]
MLLLALLHAALGVTNTSDDGAVIATGRLTRFFFFGGYWYVVNDAELYVFSLKLYVNISNQENLTVWESHTLLE